MLPARLGLQICRRRCAPAISDGWTRRTGRESVPAINPDLSGVVGAVMLFAEEPQTTLCCDLATGSCGRLRDFRQSVCSASWALRLLNHCRNPVGEIRFNVIAESSFVYYWKQTHTRCTTMWEGNDRAFLFLSILVLNSPVLLRGFAWPSGFQTWYSDCFRFRRIRGLMRPITVFNIALCCLQILPVLQRAHTGIAAVIQDLQKPASTCCSTGLVISGLVESAV